MKNARLLIVEDDENENKLWQQHIARFNAKNQSTISAQYADSIDSAKEKLFHNKFDAAIIDIRLKSQDGTKDALTNGNEVRDIILASELLIVAHVTGEPKKVSISNPAPVSYTHLTLPTTYHV